MCVYIYIYIYIIYIIKCALTLYIFFFFFYRFYSHNSSFVHGGVEKAGEEQQPVMGQVVSL